MVIFLFELTCMVQTVLFESTDTDVFCFLIECQTLDITENKGSLPKFQSKRSREEG